MAPTDDPAAGSPLAPPLPPPRAQPWKLVRARRDAIGGVCAGLAAAASVDVALVRLAFIVAGLTGIGVVAYVALWAVLPREDPSRGRPLVPAPFDTARWIRLALALGPVAALLGVFGHFWPFGGFFGPFVGPWRWHGPGFGFGFVLVLAGLAVIWLRRREERRHGPSGPSGGQPVTPPPAAPAAPAASAPSAPIPPDAPEAPAAVPSDLPPAASTSTTTTTTPPEASAMSLVPTTTGPPAGAGSSAAATATEAVSVAPNTDTETPTESVPADATDDLDLTTPLDVPGWAAPTSTLTAEAPPTEVAPGGPSDPTDVSPWLRYQPSPGPAPAATTARRPSGAWLMIARILAWLVMIGSLAGVAAVIAAERIEALSIPYPVVPALLTIAAFGAVAFMTVKARSGWAVLAILPVLLVPLADLGATSHWVGDIGDRLVAPQAAEQVTSPYHMAIGRMIVDLSHVDPKGATVTVDARTAIGRLDVVLPATASVSGHAHVRAGDIQVFGGAHRSGSGADLDIADTPAAAPPGTFVLNADAGFGVVRVCRAALASSGTNGCS